MLEFVKAVNEWMWGLILLVILCGTGIFFTIRLRFIQVRKFGEGCRLVFGHFKSSGGERKEGEMTPFQSLATAIAAQVGTGNLTGAATALIAGGPGSHLLDVGQRVLRNGYDLRRGDACPGI